jgi:hypothetical protein
MTARWDSSPAPMMEPLDAGRQGCDGQPGSHRRAKAATASRDLTAELAFLTRALRTPTLRESVTRIQSWCTLSPWPVRRVTARSPH